MTKSVNKMTASNILLSFIRTVNSDTAFSTNTRWSSMVNCYQ